MLVHHSNGACHVLAGLSFFFVWGFNRESLLFAGRFSNFACAGLLRGLAAV